MQRSPRSVVPGESGVGNDVARRRPARQADPFGPEHGEKPPENRRVEVSVQTGVEVRVEGPGAEWERRSSPHRESTACSRPEFLRSQPPTGNLTGKVTGNPVLHDRSGQASRMPCSAASCCCGDRDDGGGAGGTARRSLNGSPFPRWQPNFGPDLRARAEEPIEDAPRSRGGRLLPLLPPRALSPTDAVVTDWSRTSQNETASGMTLRMAGRAFALLSGTGRIQAASDGPGDCRVQVPRSHPQER